jgi:hypothetical protein
VSPCVRAAVLAFSNTQSTIALSLSLFLIDRTIPIHARTLRFGRTAPHVLYITLHVHIEIFLFPFRSPLPTMILPAAFIFGTDVSQ